MSNIQRVSISLLISIILVTAFAFLAYSGLFEYIETNFYNQRVTELYDQELQTKKTEIEAFHRQYQNRFNAVLSQVDVQKIFSPNWDREYIFQHNNLFDTLHSEYQGLLFVRFIDNDNKIHFSTRDTDIERRGDYRIIYKVLDESTTSIPLEELRIDPGKGTEVLIDPGQNRFIYKYALYDDLDQSRGTALFYVDKTSLELFLVSKGILQVGREVNLISNGYLFYGEGLAEEDINATASRRWSNNLVEERLIYRDEESGQRFVLMSTATDGYGNLGILVNQNVFEMGSALKVVLLTASGMTVFLLLLLIFSLRQDREVIIRNRLKRFQLEFIKEYIENQDRLDWRQLRNEIGRRKHSLKGEMKKGLGKIKGEKEEKIDQLIDESWQDIFNVLDRRSEAQPSSQVSIANIEEVVQKILSLQKTIEAQPAGGQTGGEAGGVSSGSVSGTKTPGAEQSPAEVGDAAAGPHTSAKDEATEELAEVEAAEPEELEELEEFEELEEAGEPEEIEEFEELEEVEEAEELPEAETPEELATESVEEAAKEAAEEPGDEENGELEELDELEELEEFEELEEAGEPEEIEAAEELEDAEELEEGEEAGELEAAGAEEAEEEIEEFEELEEVEEAEELEALEEAEEAEELPEAETPEDLAPESVEEAAKEAAEEPGDEENEEDEELEELEEFEELEEAGEPEEIEAAEELEDAEELEEGEEAGELEAAGAEEAEEELEEFEELEEVEEAEELEALEEAEEAEELPEAEAAESTESTERVESAEEALEAPSTGQIAHSDLTHLIHSDLEGWGSFSEEQKERAIKSIEKIEHAETVASQEKSAELEVVGSHETSLDENVEELEAVGEEESAFYQMRSAANDTYYGYSSAGVYDYSTVPVQGYLEVVGSGEEEIDEVEELSDELKEGSQMASKHDTPHETPDEYERDGSDEAAEQQEEAEEVEELEEIESAEEAEELEELEEAEELEEVEEFEDVEEVPAEVIEESGIKVEAGVYRFNIEDVIGTGAGSAKEKKSEAIVYQNGTFQVDSSTLEAPSPPTDADLKDLIDSVIDGGSVSEGEESEDTSLESIIGFGDVDLSFTIDEVENRSEENLERQRAKSDYVVLNEAGFQYDVFLKQYRSGKIGMLKSLMKISQRTGALYAAILAKQDDSWVQYDSVGFDKERTNNVVLRQSEEFYKRFLAQREPILFDLDQSAGHLQSLVSERDREYIRAVLFIPAIFQGADAYLYLGLKSVSPDVNGIIKALSQM